MRRNRILLATDGSRPAIDATGVAGTLAGALKADVAVLHVHEVGFSDRGGYSPELEALRQLNGAGATAFVMPRSGQPVDEILWAVRSYKPDLLIMGTRGRSSLAGLLLGSVSQEVVARATCPVLLVRAERGEVAAPYSIVLAVEGLAGLKPLTAVTRKLAKALQARVCAVHVSYPEGEALERTAYHASASHGEQALAAAASWLAQSGIGVETQVIEHRGGVARAIVEFARSKDADLIVMGAHPSHGEGVLPPLVGPAVAVSHRADRPVLIAKEGPDLGRNAEPAASTAPPTPSHQR